VRYAGEGAKDLLLDAAHGGQRGDFDSNSMMEFGGGRRSAEETAGGEATQRQRQGQTGKDSSFS